jgi:hypothetical protein
MHNFSSLSGVLRHLPLIKDSDRASALPDNDQTIAY